LKRKRLIVADLFCGAGGTSQGVTEFCASMGWKLDLVAVNHWERAVETHARNHPKAAHFCQDLTRLKPAQAVPGGRLDLLVASPECTHHSNARGGKPKNDQSRASAWIILEWVNALKVDRVLIENVPEFVSWGPLGVDGKALKRKRGETFQAFVKALEASGYTVAWRLLNSADYGAATSRRRLFIQAVKGRRQIQWPDPTHTRNPDPRDLFGTLPRWRAAREVIDWSLVGTSIFGRKKSLSENTLKRIEAGLKKFGGAAAGPFIVAMNYLKERGNDNRATFSLDDPLPTVTSQGNRFAFIDPFVVKVAHSGDDNCRVKPVSEPVGTVTTSNQYAICEPFLCDMRGTDPAALSKTARDLDEPHPTITAGGSHTAVIEPFILPHRQFEQMDVDSVGNPLRTVTATNGGCNALVIPFYGTGVASEVSDPLATVTTKDRFGLVEPEHRPVGIDIRFRMLQPHELAAAMGFPASYQITGNRAEQVKQIGNAVEVHQARALASAALAGAV
jgi:DNA (cytosine-5)-methyltransferase 1